MMWWLAGLAWAGGLVVVPVEGPVHAGRPTRLQAMVYDDRGEPVPGASIQAGAGGLLLEAERNGVAEFLWTPPSTSGEVTFQARGAELVESRVVVAPWPQPSINAPARVDGAAGGVVRLLLKGPDLPKPDDLRVEVSEPAQVEVRSVAEGLEVTLRTEPEPGARALVVTTQDARRVALPAVTVVRLTARPTLAFDLEPGAVLEVRLGERTYGPFVADAEGRVRATVDQRAGETLAELVVSDDLGNQLVTPYTLAARQEPVLLLQSDDAAGPGALAPEVRLVVARADGSRWTGALPRCQMPGTGEIPVQELDRSRYRLALPARSMGAQDLRLDCTVGETRVSHRVVAPSGVPTALQLKVWPEEVSIDFPVAEVTAHVIDVAGERLDVPGIQLSAERGAVTIEDRTGGSVRGEYRGGPEAVRDGIDQVRARLDLAPGSGSVARVELGHGAIVHAGSVVIHGRALDASGRPLPGVPLVLTAGEASTQAMTGQRGWATAQLDPGEAPAPVVLQVAVGDVQRAAIVPRGRRPSAAGPDASDLQSSRTLRLTAGRVSTVRLEPEQRLMFAGPDAQTRVRVYLFDRSEALVGDEIPVLQASVGTVSSPRRMPDGAYEVVYTPPLDGRAYNVTLIARSSSGSATGTTELRVEPLPLRAAVGVGVGGLSNLGWVHSVAVSLHGDVRLGRGRQSLMLRLGGMGYGARRTLQSDLETQQKRLTVVPLTLAVLARQDRGRNALWAGGGVALAPFRSTTSVSGAQLSAALGVLPPGFSVVAGGGRRLGVGEVMIEVRGLFLSSTGQGTGVAGQIGGVTGLLGYRFVID